jgi:Icc protein
MTTLHFVQISDIHISAQGDMYDMLSGRSVEFLTNIVADLNQEDDLDFVLITGDLFNDATQKEFDLFQRAIRTLQKPYYVIPGNHDRRSSNSANGLTHLQFAEHFNPQIGARFAATESQPGYWSITIKPDIQLIGLDSIKDDDWGGIISPSQLDWFKNELDTHADKLVIVAVHHPLHQLAPIDQYPEWGRFVCDNGPEVMTILEEYPQARVVLTAHHHLTKADTFGQRLHLACPAVAIYPCAYRTLRLNQQSDGAWQIAWQTHPATEEATVVEARARMVTNWQDGTGFDPEFVEAYAQLAWGNEGDRAGHLIL